MSEKDSNDNREDVRTLSVEDQARVDRFISTGLRDTQKKQLRTTLLVVRLYYGVTGSSVLIQKKKKMAGVY